MPTTRVLFACVHNAGRSQMAAAFFNQIADSSLAQATSAGTEPAAAVHPEVVAAMNEVGINVANARPRVLTPDLASQTDVLVTMGCGEACPIAPGVRRADWQLPDPKGQPPDTVRRIRDEIRERVGTMVKENGWLKTTTR